MQTILGAGGIIARELAKNLPQYTNDIRQVSRKPQKLILPISFSRPTSPMPNKPQQLLPVQKWFISP